MKYLLLAVVLWAIWRFLLRRPKRSTLVDRNEAKARAVLGVAPDADAETIRAAHRRLVAGVHPDRGGSAELARRVNAARDLLLGRME
ncbi:J domain-containing protein [uncultured Sphingomonas sp.]|uniref:J domain-containing protein n=1 Tax=uncultured Sphingomonas sp. TaxID=158754 RepID=UPI0035CC6D3D